VGKGRAGEGRAAGQERGGDYGVAGEGGGGGALCEGGEGCGEDPD